MKDSTYWRLVLITFVAITVAGNTGHVLLVGAEHQLPAAALAAVPPLALVLITHGLTGRIGKGSAGALFWFGAVGAAGIAAGAFWISWVTLRDLTAQLLNCSPEVAAVMPLLIDTTIAVASAMAVAAHRRELADAAQQVGAQVFITAPTAVPTDAPAAAVAAAAEHLADAPVSMSAAQAQLRSSTQRLAAPRAAQEPVADTAQPPVREAVTSGDAADITTQSDEVVVQRAEVGSLESGRSLALVHRTDAQHTKGAQDADAHLLRGAQVAQDAELDPAQEAARLIARGSSRLDEETLTDVLMRLSRGESHNSIAGTTGVSRNTVMRLAGMVPTEPDDEEASA